MERVPNVEMSCEANLVQQNFYFVSDVVKVAKHHIDGYIKA